MQAAAPDQQWAGSQPGPQAEYAQAGQTPVGGFPGAGVGAAGATPVGIPDQQVGAVQAATAQAEAQANELARLSDANGVFEKTLNTIDGELANRMRQPKQWAMIPEEKRQKIIAKTKRVLQKVIADIDKRLAERRAKKEALGLDPNIPTAEQQGGAMPVGTMQQGVTTEQGMATAMPPTTAAPGGTPMVNGQMTGFAESNAIQSQQQGPGQAGPADFQEPQWPASQAGAQPFDATQGFQDNIILTKLQNQNELTGNVDYEGFKSLFVDELGQLDQVQLEGFFNQYAQGDYLNLDDLANGAMPAAASPGVGFDGQSGVMSDGQGAPTDPTAGPGPDGMPPQPDGDGAAEMEEPGLEQPEDPNAAAVDGAEAGADAMPADPGGPTPLGTLKTGATNTIELNSTGDPMADGAETGLPDDAAAPAEEDAGDGMPGDEVDGGMPDEMAAEEDGVADNWDMMDEDGGLTPATGVAEEEVPEDLDNEALEEADE